MSCCITHLTFHGMLKTFNTSNTWSQEESLGTSINRTRSMSVAMGGSWEGLG
ncbi:hypothetical protein G7B40_034395 [Aetokthonos hydrillicola Thurmond2011]|jgi:hypothetical protein|uniref:Uncharacterized protein n=1 Tax=Aetokthonos hydrillicola Thurmond2011 TaxID=2712845 RepID=A0AAP5IDQ5_9CYAN|nr:hypothetical protein [Aetokthonos hydrillicola CCALA 1050]MBW4587139.1 hypothetical protein [Aetokthonos hydrillicola CCALA 1050]MDR9899611.1 hypothetical protein [Aetokthonos hydrillicola Thurmond2011]